MFFFSTFLWWSWNHLAQFANRAAVAWWWTNLSFLATVLDLFRDSDFPRKLLWGGVDGRSNSSRILRKKPKWLTLRFNGDSPWDVVIRAILNLGCSPFLSGSDAANPFSLVQQSVEVVHTTCPTHLVHTRIQRNSLSWWSSVAEYDQPLLRNSQLSTENRIDVCHQVVRACCVLLKNSVFSVPGPTLKLTDQALCCLSQVCLLRTPMSQVARTLEASQKAVPKGKLQSESAPVHFYCFWLK